MIRQQKPPLIETPPRVPDLLTPRTVLVAAICLVAVVFAVYGPSLSFQFILDDHRFTGDPRLQSAGHVWEYFTSYVWAQFPGGPATFYRPVFVLWLRINFILSEMSSWGWHLLSIAKHAAVGVLLGCLTWKLLRDRMTALVVGTLFALHPAQSESVAWVTVPDPLMSAGILGALLLYVRYRDAVRSQKEIPESSGRRSRNATRKKGRPQSPMAWLLGSATVYFAALLTKETAVVFPVVIFLLALLAEPLQLKARTGRKDEVAGIWPCSLHALLQTVPFLAATVLYLLLRMNALGGKFGAQSQHLGWSTILLSWPATLWFYSRALLWPIRSYAYADPILVESFSVRGVLLPCLWVGIVIAAVAAVIFWAWRKVQLEAAPHEAAGVRYALVIGTSLLVLPILPALDLNALNPGDFLHGRYVYLPAAGLMLLLATGWHLAGKVRGPLLGIAGIVAVTFGALTFAQEKQWRDDLTVYTVAHELAPHNTPVARNLANARVQVALQLGEEGRCSEAIPVLEQVTRDYPDEWYAWAGLGECFVQLNNLPKAEESLRRAAGLSKEPRVVQQWQAVRSRLGR